MTAPLVSVIIPTYNRVDLLKIALGSALRQTFTDLEVLVSDDASTQDVGAVVRAFNDPRVQHIRRERNVGQMQNNVLAFQAARGTFVASLHDDDEWKPEFLARLVPLLQADPEAVLAFCNHEVMTAEGVTLPEETLANTGRYGRATLRPGRHQPALHLIKDSCVPTVMASVFRASAVDWDSLPTEVGTNWDVWLGYAILRNGGAAHFVPEYLTRYRLNPHSETAFWASEKGRIVTSRQRVELLAVYLRDPRLQSIHGTIRRRYLRVVASYLSLLLQDGRTEEAQALIHNAANALNVPWLSRAGALAPLIPGGTVRFLRTQRARFRR